MAEGAARASGSKEPVDAVEHERFCGNLAEAKDIITGVEEQNSESSRCSGEDESSCANLAEDKDIITGIEEQSSESIGNSTQHAAILLLQTRYRGRSIQRAVETFVQKQPREVANLTEEETARLSHVHGTVCVEVQEVVGLPASGNMSARSLLVTVVGARNLGLQQVNLCCVVEVAGKPGSRWTTKAAVSNTSPFWDESFEMSLWYPGESVTFVIQHGGVSGTPGALYSASLASEEFACPGGFSGELLIEGCSGNEGFAYLEVRVEVVAAKVTVDGAIDIGLGLVQDINVFCVGEVPGKPQLAFRTDLIAKTTSPQWQHTKAMPDIDIDDSIVLSVFNRGIDGDVADQLLGRAVVPFRAVAPVGFDSSVDLVDVPFPSMRNAKLHIRVQMPTSLVFCTCEVPGKDYTRIQTRAVDYSAAPAWHEEHRIPGYLTGDSLEFSLWEICLGNRTRLATTSVLAHQMTWPRSLAGFKGDLELVGEDGRRGQRLRVVLRHTIHGLPPTSTSGLDVSDGAASSHRGYSALNTHGLGGGEIRIAAKRIRKHFAILNRWDFERIARGLELGLIERAVAAAELRRAERFAGARPVQDGPVDGLSLGEIREIFGRLKGLVEITRASIQGHVPDPRAETDRNRRLEAQISMMERKQAAAGTIQRWFRGLIVANSQKNDLQRELSAFSMRATTPLGVGVQATLKLYEIRSMADLSISCTRKGGHRFCKRYDYVCSTRCSDGRVEFETYNPKGSQELMFACTLSGDLGHRKMDFFEDFPVVGTHWKTLPPLREIDSLDADVSPDSDGSHGDGDGNAEKLDDMPGELFSGWLEVFAIGRHGFTWRWCVLYSTRFAVYTDDDRAEKKADFKFGPRPVLIGFRDKMMQKVSVKSGVDIGLHQYGFLFEPEGRGIGRQLFIDAGDPPTFRDWTVAISATLDRLPAVRRAALSPESLAHLQAQLLKSARCEDEGLPAALAKYDPSGSGLIDTDVFKHVLRVELKVLRWSVSDSDLDAFTAYLELQSGTRALPIHALAAFAQSGPDLEQMLHSLTFGAAAQCSSADLLRRRATLFTSPRSSKLRSPILQRKPQHAPVFTVAWYVVDHVEGSFFPSEDLARRMFAERVPKFHGAEGIFAVVMLGHDGEELRYHGSRFVYDELLVWRELKVREHVKPSPQSKARGFKTPPNMSLRTPSRRRAVE